MVKRRRQRVEVAARISTQSLDLLERRVVWRVTKDARGRSDARQFMNLPLGQAEVKQDDLPASRKLQILRLDIPMHNLRILGMQVIQGVEQLIRPGSHLFLRKWPAAFCDDRGQIVARNILHHQKFPTAFCKVIAYSRQCRMMQTSQQTRLSLELSAQSLIGKQRLFQGYRGVQSLIDRFIDSA